MNKFLAILAIVLTHIFAIASIENINLDPAFSLPLEIVDGKTYRTEGANEISFQDDIVRDIKEEANRSLELKRYAETAISERERFLSENGYKDRDDFILKNDPDGIEARLIKAKNEENAQIRAAIEKDMDDYFSTKKKKEQITYLSWFLGSIILISLLVAFRKHLKYLCLSILKLPSRDIVLFLAAAMLVLCAIFSREIDRSRYDDSIFVAVKLLTCASAAYAAWRSKVKLDIFPLIVAAVAFNPILPIRLGEREAWMVADIAVALLFVFCAIINIQKSKSAIVQ